MDNKDNIIRPSFINKIYMILLVLMPIINQYMIFGWTFLMLFSAFGMVLLVLNYKRCTKNRMWKGILVYLFYVTISLLLHAVVLDTGMGTLLLRLLNLVFTIVHFMIVAPILFDYEYGYKFYTKVIVILSIIIMIQYAQFFIMGRATKLIIPGVALNYNNISDSTELINYALRRAQSSNYFRPSSLFLEPAYYAQYVLPWLYITLSKGFTHWKKAVLAAFVTLPTILTASSLAIGGCLIIWFMFGLKVAADSRRKFNFGALVALVLLVIVIWYSVNDANVQTSVLIKMRSLSSIETASSSLSVRLLRGWECFKQFKLVDKIFGCGYGNIYGHLTKYNISTISDVNMGDISYMNGLSTMLCSLGIVGSIVYIYYFFLGRLKFSITRKYLFLCLLVLMLTSAVFDTAVYFLVIVFLFSVDEQAANVA